MQIALRVFNYVFKCPAHPLPNLPTPPDGGGVALCDATLAGAMEEELPSLQGRQAVGML